MGLGEVELVEVVDWDVSVVVEKEFEGVESEDLFFFFNLINLISFLNDLFLIFFI